MLIAVSSSPSPESESDSESEVEIEIAASSSEVELDVASEGIAGFVVPRFVKLVAIEPPEIFVAFVRLGNAERFVKVVRVVPVVRPFSESKGIALARVVPPIASCVSSGSGVKRASLRSRTSRAVVVGGSIGLGSSRALCGFVIGIAPFGKVVDFWPVDARPLPAIEVVVVDPVVLEAVVVGSSPVPVVVTGGCTVEVD